MDVNGVDVGTASDMASFWRLMNNVPVATSRRVLTAQIRRVGHYSSTHTGDVVVDKSNLYHSWVDMAMFAVGEQYCDEGVAQHLVDDPRIVGVSVHVATNVVSLLLRNVNNLDRMVTVLKDVVMFSKKVEVTPLCAPLAPMLIGDGGKEIGPPSPYSPTLMEEERLTDCTCWARQCASSLVGGRLSVTSFRSLSTNPTHTPSLSKFTYEIMMIPDSPSLPCSDVVRKTRPVSMTCRCFKFYPIHPSQPSMKSYLLLTSLSLPPSCTT